MNSQDHTKWYSLQPRRLIGFQKGHLLGRHKSTEGTEHMHNEQLVDCSQTYHSLRLVRMAHLSLILILSSVTEFVVSPFVSY